MDDEEVTGRETLHHWFRGHCEFSLHISEILCHPGTGAQEVGASVVV